MQRLEVSGAVRPLQGSLGVKGLNPQDSGSKDMWHNLYQCFSTAGPRAGTGLWHQLYRAARVYPEVCHFSFLSNFRE